MTLSIIILTVLVSLYSFHSRQVFDKLKFNAWMIHHRNEWPRFLSYGLVHADWIHLLVNMYVLWSFGGIVEEIFTLLFPARWFLYFLMLYAGGIAFSTLYDFGKYKEEPHYNAVGASGAVSAIVFSSIVLYPQGKIFFFFIPVGIPSYIFGALYLVYSAYMARKSNDNIGHSAHFWGAVFGAVFTIILKPSLFKQLLEQII
ncbi:MAG: rhomboid family intramembrane serine protease [Bacteroidales bacterium]|nr:rhomboid family intramembrane serine protease [Bacteroidales bacterium]